MSSDAPPPPPPPPPAASSAAPAAEAAPRAPAPLPLLAVKTAVDPLVTFHNYLSEEQLAAVMELVDRDLSEPYSIFTYRYFLNEWPNLCLIAKAPTEAGGEGKEKETIGVIICKAEREKCERFGGDVYRGYIAMLAVGKGHRKRGIGSELVRRAVERMAGLGCDEIVLEAEVVNNGALSLYEKMGFCRDEHLLRYYLNGNDAYRLKLWINPPPLPAAPAAPVPPVPPAAATAAR